MRCCWAVSIFTATSHSGAWSQIDLEEMPGLADYSGPAEFLRKIIKDVAGDGNFEIVDDHSFWGLFCDDGGVDSPLRIRRVLRGQLVDVTRDLKYLPAHHEHFARLWKIAQGNYVSNRDLPGLVASGRLVGEDNKAWKFMLSRYQEPGSVVGVYEPCWPGEKFHTQTFPKALEMFLVKNGYNR